MKRNYRKIYRQMNRESGSGGKKKLFLILFFVVIAATAIITVTVLSKSGILNFGSSDRFIATKFKEDLESADQASYVVMETAGGNEYNKVYGEVRGDYRFSNDNDTRAEEITEYTNSGKLTYTPITNSRELTFRISDSKSNIKSLEYIVREADTGELMEKTEVTDISESDGVTKAHIGIKNLLGVNKKYLLEIRMTNSNDKEIYFDTVIQVLDETYLDEKLSFISDFTDMLYDTSRENEVFSYLAPKAESDTTNYATANIFCATSLVTWGKLEAHKLADGIPQLLSIDDNSTKISVSYPIEVKGIGDITKRVVVNEVYAVRVMSDGKVSLKNYERKSSETILTDSLYTSGSVLALGYQSDNYVNSKTSSNSRFTCFENGGNLWLTDSEQGISEIFTFDADESNGYDISDRVYADNSGYYTGKSKSYGIEIINISDDGEVDFVVYGIQMSGNHASEKGLAVYSYNYGKNELKQDIFIASDNEMDDLAKMASKLYLSSSDEVFLLSGMSLLSVNTNTLNKTEHVNDVSGDIVSSADRVEIAYGGTKSQYSGLWKSIRIFDRESLTTHELTAQDGQVMGIVGFIGSDLVYGVANENDVKEVNGQQKAFYNKFEIVSSDGTVQKTYEGEGLYFTDASIDGKIISFARNSKNGDNFDYKDENKIIGSENVNEGYSPVVAYETNSTYRKILELTMSSSISNGTDGAKVVNMWTYYNPNYIRI